MSVLLSESYFRGQIEWTWPSARGGRPVVPHSNQNRLPGRSRSCLGTTPVLYLNLDQRTPRAPKPRDAHRTRREVSDQTLHIPSHSELLRAEKHCHCSIKGQHGLLSFTTFITAEIQSLQRDNKSAAVNVYSRAAQRLKRFAAPLSVHKIESNLADLIIQQRGVYL